MQNFQWYGHTVQEAQVQDFKQGYRYLIPHVELTPNYGYTQLRQSTSKNWLTVCYWGFSSDEKQKWMYRLSLRQNVLYEFKFWNTHSRNSSNDFTEKRGEFGSLCWTSSCDDDLICTSLEWRALFSIEASAAAWAGSCVSPSLAMREGEKKTYKMNITLHMMYTYNVTSNFGHIAHNLTKIYQTLYDIYDWLNLGILLHN